LGNDGFNIDVHIFFLFLIWNMCHRLNGL
jgi:hypothetical protein